MTVTKVVDEDKKERQQRRLLVTLFSVCVLGFSYLIYDYFNIVNHTAMPEDLSQVGQTVDSWKSSGLVNRFDPSKDRLFVYEDKWDRLSREEKIGIVTQLARYCADAKKTGDWRFEVVGNRTSAVVGALGSNGLVIQ